MRKFSLIVCILCFLASCSFANIHKKDQEVLSLFPLDNYDQNVNKWINPDDPNYQKPLLTVDLQRNHLKLFYDHTYGALSPWNQDYVNSIFLKAAPEDIITFLKHCSQEFNNRGKSGNKIGYGENYRSYSPIWADTIEDNINIAQFYNLKYNPNNRAIAVNNLYARLIPTNDVHFYSNKIAGQGYPFDNLQASSIWAGTPVYIVGTTKDKSWSLVITPWLFTAWVESNGIAKASSSFITKWQQAAKSHLGAITHTKTSIIDSKGQFLFSSYIGSVFPIVTNNDLHKILMVPAVENNYAIIKYATVSNNNVKSMPITPNLSNIANLISNLIGRPYGWGNMYFYNDCSAELKSLFVPFGIWLPRNSLAQAKFIAQHFKEIDLSSMSAQQRLSYLMQNGTPFFTMIYIEGHVFLYIGNYPNIHNKESSLMAMTYQNIWGLRPDPGDSRSVIGSSVFLPLLLQYPEAKYLQSLADKKYFRILYLDQLAR